MCDVRAFGDSECIIQESTNNPVRVHPGAMVRWVHLVRRAWVRLLLRGLQETGGPGNHAQLILDLGRVIPPIVPLVRKLVLILPARRGEWKNAWYRTHRRHMLRRRRRDVLGGAGARGITNGGRSGRGRQFDIAQVHTSVVADGADEVVRKDTLGSPAERKPAVGPEAAAGASGEVGRPGVQCEGGVHAIQVLRGADDQIRANGTHSSAAETRG
ncbi:hypothetical protein B0H14DRAFT_2581080 [Mycena olivaceomarginata]|nr:hypothetical protein B0H14DRAFT_2581080 [Mycena olivaceomarginata]